MSVQLEEHQHMVTYELLQMEPTDFKLRTAKDSNESGKLTHRHVVVGLSRLYSFDFF